MSPEEEQVYLQGQRAVWTQLLGQALVALGYSDERTALVRMVAEREAVVAKLREVCGEHGDNDWTEKDHLADVIEKHLARHLPEGEGP